MVEVLMRAFAFHVESDTNFVAHSKLDSFTHSVTMRPNLFEKPKCFWSDNVSPPKTQKGGNVLPICSNNATRDSAGRRTKKT